MSRGSQPGADAALLLKMWERVQGLPSSRQAEAMLHLAAPEVAEDLDGLSLGARDTALLRLRARLMGQRLESVTACPACGERVQLDFLAEDVCPGLRDAASLPAPVTVVEGDWRVTFRVPTCADLARAEEFGPAAAQALLRACVLDVARGGEAAGEGDIGRLPEAVVRRLDEAIEAADPLAVVDIRICCPTCAHAWKARFDIVSFLVAEIGALARQILDTVARLARGYGWREADILAMTPARRRAYLELLGDV
jgi:hypothetical protein